MQISRVGELLGRWPRRLLALTCVLLALLSAVHAHSGATVGPIEATVEVLVATRALAIGATLTAGDMRLAEWPVALRPAAALQSTDAIGRRLASPLASGDPITRQRLVTGDLAAGLPADTVAAPLTLADSGAASLIRPGDHVDLLTPPSEDATGPPAQILATDVLVLAVLPPPSDGTGGGAQLVVAIDRSSELKLAAAESQPVLATVRDHL